MAYSSIAKPTDYFNTVLYTGNGSAGHSITGVGFQPDWVWIKNRASAKHMLYDAARGATKAIFSNESTAENTSSGHLTAFGTDGFTLGDNSGTGSTNGNSENYASWNWKGGTTSGLSGGDITPSAYSYDATSGFGVYKYTGNGSADQTIPHGLGAIPQLIFYKRLDSSTNWVVQSNLLGNRDQLVLNGTDAENTDSRLSDSDNWTSTFFKVGSYGDMNNSSSDHVAYVFCNVKGYCKVGTYTGNGDANGTFVYTGFAPAFVLSKCTSHSGENWNINDSKRPGTNVIQNALLPDSTAAEVTASFQALDILSNGFKWRGTNDRVNASGKTYIYMAFAEHPFVTEGTKAAGTAI